MNMDERGWFSDYYLIKKHIRRMDRATVCLFACCSINCYDDNIIGLKIIY